MVVAVHGDIKWNRLAEGRERGADVEESVWQAVEGVGKAGTLQIISGCLLNRHTRLCRVNEINTARDDDSRSWRSGDASEMSGQGA